MKWRDTHQYHTTLTSGNVLFSYRIIDTYYLPRYGWIPFSFLATPIVEMPDNNKLQCGVSELSVWSKQTCDMRLMKRLQLLNNNKLLLLSIFSIAITWKPHEHPKRVFAFIKKRQNLQLQVTFDLCTLSQYNIYYILYSLPAQYVFVQIPSTN